MNRIAGFLQYPESPGDYSTASTDQARKMVLRKLDLVLRKLDRSTIRSDRTLPSSLRP